MAHPRTVARGVLLGAWCAGCSSDDSGSPASGGAAGGAGVGGSGGATGAPAERPARLAPAAAGRGDVAGAAGAAGGGGCRRTPAVRFVGRSDESEPGVVKIAWSGSGILFRFNGTDASVKLDDPAGYFTLLLDGVEQPRLETQKGEQSYAVASGFPPATTRCACIAVPRRRSAPLATWASISAQGRSLAPPPPAPRRIEAHRRLDHLRVRQRRRGSILQFQR